MFSGIVETTGCVKMLREINGCLSLSIKPHMHFHDIKIGDSIAVNGICLSVTELTGNDFTVSAVPETRRLTNINDISAEGTVNLERSLKVGDRIGGHYVQGHIDGTGKIINLQENGDALLVTIQLSSHLAKYIVPKGYITIDGMSITVIDVYDNCFTITLIPITRQMTIAGQYRIGSKLNIEVDILSKYIEKLAGANHSCNM